MKKILIIFMITGTCLLLLKCKKDENNTKSNDPIHYSYTLKFDFKDDTWPAGRFDWILTDQATMNIDVLDSVVTISNIINDNGMVSPATQFFENGIESCTSTWEQGESLPGYINITSGTGRNFGGEGQPVKLSLSITSSDGRTPKFTEVWTRSGTYITGGGGLTPQNYFFVFLLNNEVQTSTSALINATLTPN